LDYLIIDTPPGTSDEHISAVQLLQNSTVLDGAVYLLFFLPNPLSPFHLLYLFTNLKVIVTSPQDVSLSAVRKEINFCSQLSLRVLGVVENMSGFRCEVCGTSSSVFVASTGGGAQLAYDAQAPLIGSIPLDTDIALAGDYGIPIITPSSQSESESESAAATANSIDSIDARDDDDDDSARNAALRRLHGRGRRESQATIAIKKIVDEVIQLVQKNDQHQQQDPLDSEIDPLDF